MNKILSEIILSLKELESFRKIIKNLLFENSYAASVDFSPGIFTRLQCTGTFTGFGANQNYGLVTTLSLDSWET